jgi:hypothetical protein
MGVVRHTSAASSSRHADVDKYPYSGRPGTARTLQPKHTGPSSGHFQNFDQLLSPGPLLTSPVLYTSNALSPGAASWASGDSSETGTSHQLARKRELSAAVYTPTSSAHASPSAVPDISSQSHHFWAEHQRYLDPYQQDFPPDPSLSPPAALSGLGLPLKESPFGSHQVYPLHNVEVLSYHTTSPPSRQTRPGVRWRPLSLDARESAGAVRDNGGSCIRCFIMREKCDAEIPCNRCVTVSGRARSWKLPCTRQWLNERGDYLLPHILTSQLEIKNVDDFINNKTFFPLEGSRMEVPLTIGFGQYLVLDAVEVELIGPDIMSMLGFAPGLCAFSLKSPPIVPCWPVNVDAIYLRVKSWMSDVLNTGGSEYPEKCFPDPHPPRHRDILTLIHQHYESANTSKDDSCVVTSALRLSVAVYVMGHALTVPKSCINTLFSQIRHPDFQSHAQYQPPTPSSDSDSETENESSSSDFDNTPPVSPRAINKVIKSILLRLTAHLTRKTFTLLHTHLGPKLSAAASFESAFSASFLTLTSLAQIQSSLYERAIAGSRQNPPDLSFSMEDARTEIQRIEDDLGRYIISLFLHRWRPKKRSGSGSGSGNGITARSPTSNSSSSGSPPSLPSLLTHINTIGGADDPFPRPYINVPFRVRLQTILQSEKEAIRAAAKWELLVDSADADAHADIGAPMSFIDETLFQGSGVGNVTRVLARLCAPLIED